MLVMLLLIVVVVVVVVVVVPHCGDVICGVDVSVVGVCGVFVVIC